MLVYSFGFPHHPAIPKGLIVPFIGTSIPTNWTQFNSANGKFLVGAGSSYGVGTTGGSTSVSLSGTTTTDGSHNGSVAQRATDECGGATDTSYQQNNYLQSHNHTFSASGSAEDVYREYKLIKAIADLSQLPIDSIVLGNTTFSGLTNIHTTVDKFLRANSTEGTEGGSSTSNISYTTDVGGAHTHDPNILNVNNGCGGSNMNWLASAGSHQHAQTLTATLNTKYFYLTLWSHALQAFAVQDNMIAMWESATPPYGWRLCDGTKSTPDLRDFFIRVGSQAQMGTSGGNNQCTYTSTTNSGEGAHNHIAGNYANTTATNGNHEDNAGGHQHTLSVSKTILPPYYALSFIMAGIQ